MKYLLFFFFIFLFPKIAISQVVISGFVTDNNTGEPLPGAAVYDKNSALGSVTNIHGFFSLKTKSKEHSLVFSFVGYSPKTVTFKTTEDTSLTIHS